MRDELAKIIGLALGSVTGIFDTTEDEDLELADAILAAGYTKPPVVDRDKLVIEDGYLLLEVGHCNCAGGDEAASYHHEPGCGYEPIDDLTETIARSGYTKPRTITTAKELDKLEPLTVIRVADFEVYEKQADGEGGYFWNGVGDLEYYDSPDVLEGGPATVLYEPPTN